MTDEDTQDFTPQSFLTGNPDALHVFIVREGDLPLVRLVGADGTRPLVDSWLADEGLIPPGGTPPPGMPPPASPLPATPRRLPRGLLIGALLSLVALLLGIALLVLSYLGPPAQATVLLIPRTWTVSLTRNVQSGRGLPARVLAPITVSHALTVPSSGTGHTQARVAQGRITFYNGAFETQTIAAGTTLAGQDGVVAVTDAAAVIPAARPTTPPTYGAATVPAHAASAGAAGNIAAYDLNTACCATSVLAKNLSAFAGGQDARTFRVVAQADIDTAARHLTPQVQAEVQARLVAALYAGERLASLPCQPRQTASANVGQAASSVTVTVAATCQGVAYPPVAVQSLAATLLSQKAAQQTHLAERIVGAARALVVSAQLSRGTVTLTLAASGLFTPAWTARDFARMATSIAGKTVASATRILDAVPGVRQAHVTVTGSATLPNALSDIHLLVEMPMPEPAGSPAP